MQRQTSSLPRVSQQGVFVGVQVPFFPHPNIALSICTKKSRLLSFFFLPNFIQKALWNIQEVLCKPETCCNVFGDCVVSFNEHYCVHCFTNSEKRLYEDFWRSFAVNIVFFFTSVNTTKCPLFVDNLSYCWIIKTRCSTQLLLRASDICSGSHSHQQRRAEYQ